MEEAVSFLRNQHPDILMTVCYAHVPETHMRNIPENVQVAHFHLYLYGVLGELFHEAGLWDSSEPFPGDFARSLLRAEAPSFESWRPSEDWKLEATGINRQLFYIHDWTDPDKWDLWLYEHYSAHRASMRLLIDTRLDLLADWADLHDIPAVIGEGYVGYTPLLTGFEEGPVGKDIAEYAIAKCQKLNFWGIILCSNSAPHHPFWQDIAWQKRMNAAILAR